MTTRFLDAARVFGPQKGATPADVEHPAAAGWPSCATGTCAATGATSRRVPGGGAAGGLAGGLAALGARLVPGSTWSPTRSGSTPRSPTPTWCSRARAGWTQQSFEGKVVGGVAERAARGRRAVRGRGRRRRRDRTPIRVTSLVEVCGVERALHATAESITAVTEGLLDEAVRAVRAPS